MLFRNYSKVGFLEKAIRNSVILSESVKDLALVLIKKISATDYLSGFCHSSRLVGFLRIVFYFLVFRAGGEGVLVFLCV